MNLEKLITKTYNCFIYTYKLTSPIIIIYCIFYVILAYTFELAFEITTFQNDSLLYYFNMNNVFFLSINLILGTILDILMIKVIIHFHHKNKILIRANEILKYLLIFLKLLFILYVLPILFILILPETIMQILSPILLVYYVFIIILFFTAPYLILEKNNNLRQALIKSYELTNNHKGLIFLFTIGIYTFYFLGLGYLSIPINLLTNQLQPISLFLTAIIFCFGKYIINISFFYLYKFLYDKKHSDCR